jgi:hypothetical protein
MKTQYFILAAVALLLTTSSFAQEKKTKYAAEAPPYLLTPDKVETDLLGGLEFFDVCPARARLTKLMISSIWPGA